LAAQAREERKALGKTYVAPARGTRISPRGGRIPNRRENLYNDKYEENSDTEEDEQQFNTMTQNNLLGRMDELQLQLSTAESTYQKLANVSTCFVYQVVNITKFFKGPNERIPIIAWAHFFTGKLQP
jgi:hypothetical protein